MKSFLIKAFVILLAAAANLGVAYYWYGNHFARQWAESSHRSAAEFSHPSHAQLGIAIVASIVTAIAFALVGRKVAGKNAGVLKRQGAAILVAVIAWAGFAAATAAKHYAFLGHSNELLALDSGYDLAAMLVTGFVVAIAA